MWVDVQKKCGMGLACYAYLCVPSFVHTTLHTMDERYEALVEARRLLLRLLLPWRSWDL